jgi:hypothetical protein
MRLTSQTLLCDGVGSPKTTVKPLTSLYLALLERLGVQAERFGDSTGKLTNLA